MTNELTTPDAPNTPALDGSGLCLHGQNGAPMLRTVPDGWLAWDGASETTTHMIRLDRASYVQGRDVFAYVEIRTTGRGPRWQYVNAGSGGYRVDGVKCRYRFTGEGDSGEWFDGVLGRK